MAKIGLALGGGGARGLAHIGVLRVLEREKIPLHSISGTSMGAIVGGCYAVEPSIDVVEAKIKKALESSMFSQLKIDYVRNDAPGATPSFFKKARNFVRDGYLVIVEKTQYALVGIEKLEYIINAILPDIDISETKIKFNCVATDLTNGAPKIFSSGSLRRSVLASASIPGFFPPVIIDGIYYNDGGAVSVTPVDAAKAAGAGMIVASNVKSTVKTWKKPENAGEVIRRSNYISGAILNEIQLRNASVVISPDIGSMHWTDFRKIDLMIERGIAAAEEKLPLIKASRTFDNLTEKVRGWFRPSSLNG